MTNFVSVDIELATDISTSICEIAFCKFIDGQEPVIAQSLIKPVDGPSVGAMQFMIHGIQTEDLINAPSLGSVWSQFEEFIGDLPLVAHNATQDFKKLTAALALEDIQISDYEFFDTMTISRNSSYLIADESYGLEDLCNQLEIEWFEAQRSSGGYGHAAAVDAAACGMLFLELLKPFNGDVLETLDNLGMRAGQISQGQVKYGNTKNPKKSFWSSMKTFSANDFEAMKNDLVSQGFELKANHHFSGKNFVLTLFFEGWSEPEIWLAVALSGGEMKTSISKKVDFLLEGVDPTGRYPAGTTSKSKEARALIEGGKSTLEILDQQAFMDSLGEEILSIVQGLKG